jgi:hypothetical protein
MSRELSIIKRCILEQDLSLKGKIVLTEVGTNGYLYTPIIPLLAGASKVIAWANDTPYGKAIEIENSLCKILTTISYSGEIIIRLNDRNIKDAEEADLITNSGNIRPINLSLLQNCKPGLVIPLMYEAWELRENDIDINFCKQKGINVAGTWENHPSIKVFDYVGLLGAKMMFESGLEIKENRVWIWSDDDFGTNIKNTVDKLGASEAILSIDLESFYAKLPELDVLFLADYSETRTIIGQNALIDIGLMNKLNPNLTIVHLYGKIEINDFKPFNFILYPNKNGQAQVMSETLAFLGLEPLIRLQVAGFKVGEQLLTNKLTQLAQVIC